MSTRISVVKNPNGQFQGWMCKHSSKTTTQNAECDGHAILCERCASAVSIWACVAATVLSAAPAWCVRALAAFRSSSAEPT